MPRVTAFGIRLLATLFVVLPIHSPVRADARPPDLGPNVLIFDPTMPTSQIQATVDAIAAQQVDDEMGTRRYTLLFKPGVYGSASTPLTFQVGYYTEVAGLGASPTDVIINGHVDVYNRCNVCSPQDGAAIVNCVLQGQSCAVPVSAACLACAVSGDTTSTAAALVVHDQKAAELNIAGCVGAASGDPSSAGCGAKLVARDWCVASACAVCADPACTQQAAAGVCATANAEAQCAAPYLADCVRGANQLEIGFNLVKVFCGP